VLFGGDSFTAAAVADTRAPPFGLGGRIANLMCFQHDYYVLAMVKYANWVIWTGKNFDVIVRLMVSFHIINCLMVVDDKKRNHRQYLGLRPNQNYQYVPENEK
jgi:hypothetical protein